MSTPKKIKVTVREATGNDVAAIVELNKVAYPVLGESDCVWGISHIKSHLRVFPKGQLVAVHKGKIIGSSSSLIVDLGPNPLRAHTWAGITDSGYFTNHDPSGDTLYGADVCVHPEYRGQGVGALIYEKRRDICKKLNLRRILAGGRLWNYSECGLDIKAEEYALRVARGELKDLVLSFQISQGFSLRGVLPNYIIDPKSKNNASLIEWINTDYKPEPGGPRKVRITCVQYKMRKVKSFADFERSVTYFVDVAGDYRSDFVLFPELFTIQLLSQVDALTPQEGMKKLAAYTNKVKKLMSQLARKYDVTIIAGSHPTYKGKLLQNIAYTCLPDGSIYEQAKIHVTPNERKWWGITGGNELNVIQTPSAKIGVLICYDVEFPETARHLADEGAEIIFVPFCTDNRQGYLRVRYCAHARAIETQTYVALAGNVGNLPDVLNMDVQYAQAAVLTPSDFPFSRDGIAAEAEANEEMVLICDLDLDDLQEARTAGTVTPYLDRRPDMFEYRSLFKGPTEIPNEGPLGGRRELDKDS